MRAQSSIAVSSPRFLGSGSRQTQVRFDAGQVIFLQGERSPCVYQIRRGHVALSVNLAGRAAGLAILNEDDFLGSGCLFHHYETATATAATQVWLTRFDRSELLRELHDPGGEHASDLCAFLVEQNALLQQRLARQMLTCSSSRLAYLLFELGGLHKSDDKSGRAPRWSQERLAGLVGTTRSRVSLFLKGFRDREHIDVRSDHFLVRRSIAEEIEDFAEGPDRRLSAPPRIEVVGERGRPSLTQVYK